MSAALQRINLNLPPEERERLRALAQAAKTPDAAYARELLVEALAGAERAGTSQASGGIAYPRTMHPYIEAIRSRNP